MFLEDKLNERWKDTDSNDKEIGLQLLNICVGHIRERSYEGMNAGSFYQLVKQTDMIWREWCQKNIPRLEGAQNMFRTVYIVPRLSKLPTAVAYFDITEEEILAHAEGGAE